MDKASRFPHKQIPFPTSPGLAGVADAMRNAFAVDGPSFNPVAVAKNPSFGFKGEKDFVKFLDGDWVEHWVLLSFSKIRKEARITDLATTLRTTKDPYDFEFDVAAIQGYQLHAVSCTRSNDRHLCKSKLFEAYVRATQLGGDEAKVGLVCCDRNVTELQRQVTEAWRAKREHVKVFGPADLIDLSCRFETWLEIR